MSQETLLRLEHITKKFGTIMAVDDVSFEIKKGEIHGLIGENGSGKSTISSIISGLYHPTAGKMILDDKEYLPVDQICANESGISIIVQEMCTIEELTVAENIFLGKEKQFMRSGVIRHKKMNLEAEKLLSAYGFSHIKPEEDVASYGFEDRKLIELVKNTYFNPRLLIVDETTTALAVEGRTELLKTVRRLRENGAAVILISHDLTEVLEFCDRITVLRDGKYITTVDNDNVTEDELKKYMIGREMAGHYYRDSQEIYEKGASVLKVEDVSVEGKLDNISFELYEGEILGIGGLTDSGMHELGKALYGACRKRKGKVTAVKGNHTVRHISDAIQSGIIYTSKNRDIEGLINDASIKENISLGNLDHFGGKFFVSEKKEKKYAEEHAQGMQVKMQGPEQFIATLSGGNKQKVVLAKWLSREPDILILDSPTRGIDIKVKRDIYELMQELVKQKKAILLISEEIMELIGMCDRVLILKQGQIAGELLRSDGLTEEKIINYII